MRVVMVHAQPRRLALGDHDVRDDLTGQRRSFGQ
jgi:hypothetical protein